MKIFSIFSAAGILISGGQISGELADDGKNHDVYPTFSSKALDDDLGTDHIYSPLEGRLKKNTSASLLARLKKLPSRDRGQDLGAICPDQQPCAAKPNLDSASETPLLLDRSQRGEGV